MRKMITFIGTKKRFPNEKTLKQETVVINVIRKIIVQIEAQHVVLMWEGWIHFDKQELFNEMSYKSG